MAEINRKRELDDWLWIIAPLTLYINHGNTIGIHPVFRDKAIISPPIAELVHFYNTTSTAITLKESFIFN
jgi:hypothetical protein